MPSDYLLEIDGVQGESKDSKHPNAIDVESFSWGGDNPGSAAGGGGAGAGKVRFADVHFSARVNKASPELFVACASGKHFKKARLIVRKQGDQQQEYYIVDFEDVLVSQYRGATGSLTDSLPVDQFAFNFAKVKFQYQVQGNTGALDPPITTGWDLRQNTKQ
jgi:type VI secretion system secreted protein Hcp